MSSAVSRHPRGRWIPATLALPLVLGLVGCGGSPANSAQPGADPPRRTDTPALNVSTVASGLTHVWDIGFLPDGTALVTQRPGRIALLSGVQPGATVTDVQADLGDVMARGEGGLMGMVIHPDFATSRRFTTCQTHGEGGQLVDVRLVTWQLAADGRSAQRLRELLTGLPVNQSGRHSGCRPTLAPDGSLFVGTGDTAHGTIAQDRGSLGGKVLRIDLATGGPAPGNPFAGAANPAERLIWTYGHRNVQGVAVRPDAAGYSVFSAEHGPDRDDEVNKMRPGGNYGWDPGQGGTVGGYDESVPMTDLKRFPDAVPAIWSTGSPVEATSGLALLSGSRWGALDGSLAVAALRGSKLLLLRLDGQDKVTEVSIPPALDGSHGRLRAARLGPDGALFVTSSNGDNDVVLRIDPA